MHLGFFKLHLQTLGPLGASKACKQAVDLRFVKQIRRVSQNHDFTFEMKQIIVHAPIIAKKTPKHRNAPKNTILRKKTYKNKKKHAKTKNARKNNKKTCKNTNVQRNRVENKQKTKKT
jgi:hypothetical protein